jgi:cobalt/nickel transport system ATP-binding protein
METTRYGCGFIQPDHCPDHWTVLNMTNITKNTPAIFFRDVSFSYPDKTIALKNISLEVKPGEKIGIIGPNGAGKSSLITLLNGVQRAKGEIQIYGNRISNKTDKLIKSLVGIVFQNPDDQLFCPTIFEDIAFGPMNMGLDEHQINIAVKLALESVGLKEYADRSSHHLSFGERKLASIATILSMKPDIIAFDEPTSNLDSLHRRKIIGWIQNWKKTCIITSHDLDMIYDTCDRLYILNGGRISANGPVKEILQDEKLLKENNLELPLRLQTIGV